MAFSVVKNRGYTERGLRRRGDRCVYEGLAEVLGVDLVAEGKYFQEEAAN